MGENWEMADDCEHDAIEYACELANEEFIENYNKYFIQECQLASNKNGDDSEEDDFGNNDSDHKDGGDWYEDYGLDGNDMGGDGGDGGDGDDGGILLDILDFGLEVLDIFTSLAEAEYSGIQSPHINVPVPKINFETHMLLSIEQTIFGDSPHMRALERAINDIPEIKMGAFEVCLEELSAQLTSEFAGFPEAYIGTIYSDRGNSSLRTINNWDPNLSGLLPDSLHSF